MYNVCISDEDYSQSHEVNANELYFDDIDTGTLEMLLDIADKAGYYLTVIPSEKPIVK